MQTIITLSTGLHTILPNEAEQLLSLPTQHNRRTSPKHVKVLANALENNRWIPNGETIKLGSDPDGNQVLIDGQHRLSACVMANKPLRTYVISDLDTECFDTIDSGKRRNLSDVLSVMGTSNCSLLAGALCMVDMYYAKKLGPGGKSYNYPNEVAKELYDKYEPEICKSVNMVATLKKTLPLPPTVAAAGHYIFSAIADPSEPTGDCSAQADTFLDKLGKGIGLGETCPVRHLRELCFRIKDRQHRWNRFEYLAGLIKTWNHVRFDRPMSRPVKRYNGGMADFPKAK